VVLPRLFDAPPLRLPLQIAPPLALATPTLVVLGFWQLPGLLPVGGALATIAAILFAVNVIHLFVRSSRRGRPGWAHLAFAPVAAASLLAGVGLGMAFALFPVSRFLVTGHAWTNVLGFAGAMIMLISHSTLRHFRPLAPSMAATTPGAGRWRLLEPGFVTLIALPAGIASLLLAEAVGSQTLRISAHLLLLVSAVVFAAQCLSAIHRSWWARRSSPSLRIV